MRAYDVIAVEDLRIRNMTRSASGTVEEPGSQVAAKAGLNRSILDAAGLLPRSPVRQSGRRWPRGAIRRSPVYQRHVSRLPGPLSAPQAGHGICTQCGSVYDADAVGAFNVATRAGLGSLQLRVPPVLGSCRL